MKNFLRRFWGGFKEFFNPRDWVPSIPLPPKRTGPGVMPLWDAIKGFDWKEKP